MSNNTIDMKIDEITADTTQWTSLSMTLSDAIQALPMERTLDLPEVSGALEDHIARQIRAQAFQQGYEEHATLCKQALTSRFSQSNQWPPTQKNELYFLQRILLEANILVNSIVPKFGQVHSTIFSFPIRSVENVALWLCIEYWERAGIAHYLDRLGARGLERKQTYAGGFVHHQTTLPPSLSGGATAPGVSPPKPATLRP